MDCDKSQALAVRKVSRTQKLDGKEYAASKLADVLRLRKLKKL
jgi:lipopolysaccharide biosynthesis protein